MEKMEEISDDVQYTGEKSRRVYKREEKTRCASLKSCLYACTSRLVAQVDVTKAELQSRRYSTKTIHVQQVFIC